MNILEDDINSSDLIEKLIFEKGLRIKNVLTDKSLDLLVLILNNGKLIQTNLSLYPILKSATHENLENWTLIGNGIGVHWTNLDEELSLKGFIKGLALKNILHELETAKETELV